MKTLLLDQVITTIKTWSGVISTMPPLGFSRGQGFPTQQHCVYLKKLKNKNEAIRKLSKSKQVDKEEEKKSKKTGSKAKLHIYIYMWSLEIQVVCVLFLFVSDIEISRCPYKNIFKNYNLLKEIESHALSIVLFI